MGARRTIGQVLIYSSGVGFKCHIQHQAKTRTCKDRPYHSTRWLYQVYLSPGVTWNNYKPFKAKVTEKYDAWMADGAHSFTAAGTMRGPPRREIVKWVLEAWKNSRQRVNYPFFQKLRT